MSGLIGTSNTKSKILGRSLDTARAWCNISNSGVVNDSFNVSSVSDGTAGIYTPNFSSNMANVHYAVVATADAGGSARAVTYYDQLVGSVILKVQSIGTESPTDPDSLSVVIFGD